MLKIGVLAEGENPTGQSIVDGLKTLNQMIEGWTLESLMIRGLETVEITLTPGQASYTWTPGGDINLVPTALGIQSAHLIALNTGSVAEVTMPMEILTDEQWEDIVIKSISTSYPYYLRYNPTYPVGRIDLFPIPNAPNKLRMRIEGTLQKFSNANASIDVPPGYEAAMEYGLAVLLAPEYGVSPSEIVVSQAVGSKAKIKQNNSRLVIMTMDSAVMAMSDRRGCYNIYSDQ